MDINKLFKRLSIRKKLVIAYTGFVLSPLLIIGAFSIYFSSQVLQSRALSHLKDEVSSRSDKISQFLRNVEADALYLSQSPTLLDWVNAPRRGKVNLVSLRAKVEREFLAFAHNRRQAYYQVRYLDERGWERIRINSDGVSSLLVPANQLQNKQQRYYFQEALKMAMGELYVSPMDLNIEQRSIEIPYKPVVRYATPVFDETGSKRGIAIINIFGRYLLRLAMESYPEADRTSFIVNKEGTYLAWSEGGSEPVFGLTLDGGKRLQDDYSDRVAARIISSRSGTVPDGIDEIITFAPIFPNPNAKESFWVLGVGLKKAAVFAPVTTFRNILVITAAIGLLASILIGVLSARHFTRPIKEMCAGAEVIAKGNFDHRLDIQTNDEIEELAHRFNVMAQHLKESKAKMERWNEALQEEVEKRTLELLESEQKVRHAGRLASLGELSAGVLHEVRNPLAAIKTTAQAMNEDVSENCPPVCPRDKYLIRIAGEINRLNAFLKTFSSFAKPQPPNLFPCDLRNIIRDVITLLEKEATSKGITIEESYSPELPQFAVDFQQMQQVFLNLLLNAVQAMPDGGRIKIEGTVLGSETPEEGASPRLQIAIKDTGHGIPQESLDNIFNPFFSTKPGGTGLGLPIAQRILEHHGGTLTVTSFENEGTTFVITLPAGHGASSSISLPEEVLT